MKGLEDVPNSEIRRVIDEWISSERDRQILKRRVIDGIHFEPLAEEFGLSVRQTKYIVGKGRLIIARNLRR